jgi:acyl-CoA thioester hydrolase
MQFSEQDCVLKEKVYYADTDAGGVVYYANYLVYFEKARTEWMDKRGLNVQKLSEGGILFVVSNLSVDYKAPARYADTVKIYAKLTKLTPVRMHFAYAVKKEGPETLLCEASTVMVCINRQFKPAALPESIAALLKNECAA